MGSIFNTILYQPILNLLVFFYNSIGHDMGVSIIIVTVLVRLVLVPSFAKSLRSQRALQNIQPEIDALREKYKDNPEKQSKEMMAFYKNNKINPLSSCLPLVIQLPILLALYRVILNLQHFDAGQLYHFIANPVTINAISLHFINIMKPNLPLAALAGLAQFWQSWMLLRKPKTEKPKEKKPADAASMTNAISRQMTYLFPVMTIIISIKLPAGLPMYWLATTLFAIGQQYYIFKTKPKSKPEALKPA